LNEDVRVILSELVLAHDELADLSRGERRLRLRTLIAEELPALDPDAAAEIAEQDIDGYGRISDLMTDDSVTDVMINGPDEVWVERGALMERTDHRFGSGAELEGLIERLVGNGGGRIDPFAPIGDVKLADGSRMHVVLPPVAPSGPLVSIRRFPASSFTLSSLEAAGMFDSSQGRQLRDHVRDRRTILVSGATGTGKTTLLNALLGEVAGHDRVVIIEETPELRPRLPHYVSLLARNANVEGEGRVDQSDLLRAALRMRPDRIVVGEVRGAESLVALGAMSTGHEGSMASVHASSAAKAIGRMVELALQAAAPPSEASLTAIAGDAIDVCVHLERSGGVRRVGEIRCA
jgi:pilus assembly protein CpaF